MVVGVRRRGWVAVGNRDVALGARLEGCVVVGAGMWHWESWVLVGNRVWH